MSELISLRHAVLCYCSIAASLTCLPGCSKGKGPPVVAAGGKVTYQGKALPNADVAFAPMDGSSVAGGRTGSDGQFKLGTFAPNDGAIVGKHRVSVIARGSSRPAKANEGTGMPGDTVPGDPLIPEKYFSQETSGLTYEVKSGSNFFEIKLE